MGLKGENIRKNFLNYINLPIGIRNHSIWELKGVKKSLNEVINNLEKFSFESFVFFEFLKKHLLSK